MTNNSIWLLSLVLSAGVVNAALATACVKIANSNLITYGEGLPCGVVTPDSGFTTCCNDNGSECLGDGICRSPGTTGDGTSGSFTGYYIGGCTDPSYLDPSCSPYCRDVARQDIVYNAATKTWTCCGVDSNGDVHCDNPATTEKFNAPAPSALTATYTIGSSVVTGPATSSTSKSSSSTSSQSSTSSSTSTSIPASKPSSTSSQQTSSTSAANDNGLSAGAKAGIGIAAAAGVLAILVGGFLFMRRRKRRTINESKNRAVEIDTAPDYENGRIHVPTTGVQEMDNKRRVVHEM